MLTLRKPERNNNKKNDGEGGYPESSGSLGRRQKPFRRTNSPPNRKQEKTKKKSDKQISRLISKNNQKNRHQPIKLTNDYCLVYI